MELKLCYKTYPFKINLKACKVFFELTGLDLQTVLMKYISVVSNTRDLSLNDRLGLLNELYTRDIACKAIHCLIKQDDKNNGVSIAEIEDGTFRVGWFQSDREDDLSEPWPMVMCDIALKINTYFVDELQIKKSDTSEG